MQKEKTHDQPLQDYISDALKSIQDFVIIPIYNPELQVDRYPRSKMDPMTHLYHSHLESQSSRKETFKSKTVSFLRFYCGRCRDGNKRKQWSTTLGVCDIPYRLYARPLSQRMRSSRMRQENELNQKFEVKRRLMDLLYKVQFYLKRKVQLKSVLGRKNQWFIQELIRKYEIVVEFNHKLYKQYCKECESLGHLVPEDGKIIAGKFASQIARILFNRKLVYKYRQKSNDLKDHKSSLCTACMQGECPYKYKLPEEEEPDPTLLLLDMELYDYLNRENLQAQLTEHDKYLAEFEEEDIQDILSRIDEIYPFSTLQPNQMEMLRGEVGKYTLKLIILNRKYMRSTPQQKQQIDSQIRLIRYILQMLEKQQDFEDWRGFEDQYSDLQEEEEDIEGTISERDSEEDMYEDYDRKYAYEAEPKREFKITKRFCQ